MKEINISKFENEGIYIIKLIGESEEHDGCYKALKKLYPTVDSVAKELQTHDYIIEKILNGKMIHGQRWKPNIFFKTLEDDYYIPYIVVYKNDWDNYSEVKKRNRLKKLIPNSED